MGTAKNCKVLFIGLIIFMASDYMLLRDKSDTVKKLNIILNLISSSSVFPDPEQNLNWFKIIEHIFLNVA